jgi:hypothetical protein
MLASSEKPTPHSPRATTESRYAEEEPLKRRGYFRRVWPGCCVPVFWACLTFAGGSPLYAQARPIAERLSPETLFYLEWRGTASLGGAERKNHLLQLLADPALAPLWLTFTRQISPSAPKGASPVAAFLLPDLISLMDNSVVFGIVPNPDARRPPTSGKTVPLIATFLVYDLTGKADLVQKWRALSAMSSKTPTEVTKYDFGGTWVEVRATRTSASYMAQTGSYFLASDQKQVMEDLITRFCGTGAGSPSVSELPEYGQIRKYVGHDAALDFFGRMPDLASWNPSESTKSIHLEKIHALGIGLSFDDEVTRLRGAVLGDASPEGPFDLVGASGATFQTWPVVERAPTFSISRINLAALYRLFMGAVIGNLPGQAAHFAASEKAAESFLGMPLIDALQLSTGEIASMTTVSDDGTLERLFALSIQKPDAVLRVVRALNATMIVSEDSSGPTTYLNLAYSEEDPQTHVHRKRFYYLAITPHMLLAAPQKMMLQQAIERLGSGAADPAPAGAARNPDFAHLRSRLPERLSGLGAADLSQIPWDKVFANLQSRPAASANQPNQQPPDWSWLKGELISRYLHFALSGWWKDSNGVYFDSYIQ